MPAALSFESLSHECHGPHAALLQHWNALWYGRCPAISAVPLSRQQSDCAAAGTGQCRSAHSAGICGGSHLTRMGTRRRLCKSCQPLRSWNMREAGRVSQAVDDSAIADSRGCYTSMHRICDGQRAAAEPLLKADTLSSQWRISYSCSCKCCICSMSWMTLLI